MKFKEKVTKITKKKINRFISIAVITGSLILNTISFETKPKIIPEYKRTMDTLIMHYQPDKFTIQKEIIYNLPKYSKIIYLVDECFEKRLENECNLLTERNIQIITCNLNPRFKLFIQDQMEIMIQNNKPLILLPTYFQIEPNIELEKTLVSAGFEVHKTKVLFSGGNITSDYFNKKNILFIGETEINLNLKYYPDLSKENIINMFKEEFYVDTVCVIGPQNPNFMYHLDQTFMIIRPGEVIIYDLKVPILFQDKIPKEVVQVLENTKITFEGLNYKIHTLPLDIKDLFQGKYYLCGIPYTDKQTKEQRVILPLFPEEKMLYPIASKNNREVRNFFIDLEVYPSSINDYLFYTRSGGLHCIISVCK